MTLQEMSIGYRRQAALLRTRIVELEQKRLITEEEKERAKLENRIRSLSPILRETRELSVLLERYYEGGYHRNERYTL